MNIGNFIRGFLVLLVVLAGMAFPYQNAAAVAPVIDATNTKAIPDMISLFGDRNPSVGTPRGSPFGPNWTTIMVKASVATGSPAITSVKAKVGTFLASLLPSNAGTLSSGGATAWQAFIDAQDAAFTLMETSAGSGVWKGYIDLEYLFGQAATKFPPSVFKRLGQQALNMGEKTIAVSVTNTEGTATGSVKLWVVDAQIMLRGGWNLRSTPMALNTTTWASLLALGNRADSSDPIIQAVFKYNAALGVWQDLAGSPNISPLEGYYIFANKPTSLGATLFRSVAGTVQPASKELTRGKWNLIGTAPDFTEKFTIVTPNKMRGLLPIDTVLNSVQFDWATVISPGEQDFKITETYTYTAISPNIALGSYDWMFGSPGWSFTHWVDALGGSMPSGYDATQAKGWTVPFGGYWVFITSSSSSGTTTPVVLAGKNVGILTDAWLLQLLTLK